jgi:hypothetical protein
MTFSITIGSFQLFNFVRLNVAYARKVFGDAPICLYDAPSEESPKVQALAEEYGCAYVTERVNRGHFGGDIQSAVIAIAFAQQHQCDVGIKLNQRTILLSPEIPQLLAREFKNPEVTLVTPNTYPAESIIDQSSRFHSLFPAAVDVLCFRARDWDAQGVADRYTRQWKESDYKYATYSEVFWGNESLRLGSAHKKVDWLTTHDCPQKYLRKIQNREADYNAAAVAIGLPAGQFATAEWSKLKPGQYRPSPRA